MKPYGVQQRHEDRSSSRHTKEGRKNPIAKRQTRQLQKGAARAENKVELNKILVKVLPSDSE